MYILLLTLGYFALFNIIKKINNHFSNQKFDKNFWNYRYPYSSKSGLSEPFVNDLLPINEPDKQKTKHLVSKLTFNDNEPISLFHYMNISNNHVEKIPALFISDKLSNDLKIELFPLYSLKIYDENKDLICSYTNSDSTEIQSTMLQLPNNIIPNYYLTIKL